MTWIGQVLWYSTDWWGLKLVSSPNNWGKEKRRIGKDMVPVDTWNNEHLSNYLDVVRPGGDRRWRNVLKLSQCGMGVLERRGKRMASIGLGECLIQMTWVYGAFRYRTSRWGLELMSSSQSGTLCVSSEEGLVNVWPELATVDSWF